MNFTLGQDETPPVVNIVSPSITGTEGGEDVAEVIENSQIVLKIAGYDNVGVEQLLLRGVSLSGSDYVLTGVLDDVLSDSDFAPQSIPGGLNAFSALKLLKMPAFSNAQGINFDSYPVQVTAIDGVGNQSTSTITVAVVNDKPPTIVEARLKKSQHLPRDLVELDVQARDDLGVTEIQVSYYLDNDTTAFATQIVDASSGIIPAENVQAKFKLNLPNYNISNANHVITINISASDSQGQNSLIEGGQEFKINLDIVADNQPPIATIVSPILNTRLYYDDIVTFRWSSVDDSIQKLISFTVLCEEIWSKELGL